MPQLKSSGTDRLILPSDPEAWVEMKSKASWGDKTAAQNAMMKISQVDLAQVDPAKAHLIEADMESGRGVLTEIETGAFFGTLLERLIVAWNFTDENDHPLPVSIENLEMLEAEDGDFLMAEARKRLGQRPKVIEGPFERRSPAQSSGMRSNSRMRSGR
jgi:hypothetical protein